MRNIFESGEVRCKCGKWVRPRGLGMHRTGQEHRTRLTRREFRARGFIELPGTTSRHIVALIRRQIFEVVGFPHYSPGTAKNPGYTSHTAGVKAHIALRLAQGTLVSTLTIQKAAQKALPFEGPVTLREALGSLRVEASSAPSLSTQARLEKQIAVLEDLQEERGEVEQELEQELSA